MTIKIPSLAWNYYSKEHGYDALLLWMNLNPSEDGIYDASEVVLQSSERP